MRPGSRAATCAATLTSWMVLLTGTLTGISTPMPSSRLGRMRVGHPPVALGRGVEAVGAPEVRRAALNSWVSIVPSVTAMPSFSTTATAWPPPSAATGRRRRCAAAAAAASPRRGRGRCRRRPARPPRAGWRPRGRARGSRRRADAVGHVVGADHDHGEVDGCLQRLGDLGVQVGRRAPTKATTSSCTRRLRSRATPPASSAPGVWAGLPAAEAGGARVAEHHQAQRRARGSGRRRRPGPAAAPWARRSCAGPSRPRPGSRRTPARPARRACRRAGPPPRTAARRVTSHRRSTSLVTAP